jgi:hypothetical protein
MQEELDVSILRAENLLKKEVFSETSVNIFQITQCHIPEDNNVQAVIAKLPKRRGM